MRRITALVIGLALMAVTLGATAARADRFIVRFDPAFPEAARQALVARFGARMERDLPLVDGKAVSLPAPAARALAVQRGVRFVEEDVRVYAVADETPWGIQRMGAPGAWSQSVTGAGVNVAVIDTGIALGHPDLAVEGGANFVAGASGYGDDNGHGTHVAGTIAALANGAGVVGAAPAARLYAVKVLDASGSGYLSDVVAGIQWCLANDMDVLNMSLGANSGTQTMKDAVDASYGAGQLLVAAAGNSGNPAGKGDNVGYPARYESVIAVAASDVNNKRASFSSTGPAVELIAPGVNIASTVPGGYATNSGTSMASPHVAGAAALAWAANPALTNSEVRGILQSTAQNLGLPQTYQGHGLVRADLAVAAALPVVPPETGDIQGTVTSADTGAPIAGATVTVGTAGPTATADANGAYTLAGVPVGTHSVTASARGYESASASVSVLANVTATQGFVLTPATVPVLKKLTVAVSAGGPYNANDVVKVTVTVTDSQGGVGGAAVKLAIVNPSGQKVAAGSGSTNDQGVASFSWKSKRNDPKGTYKAVADVTKEGYEPASGEASFELR
ncbi:MAG: S8 family serine peptidase [Armatimonadetes bacterium]|nr:S8 family serine peptidase [Armatimonadota bacterium]